MEVGGLLAHHLSEELVDGVAARTRAARRRGLHGFDRRDARVRGLRLRRRRRSLPGALHREREHARERLRHDLDLLAAAIDHGGALLLLHDGGDVFLLEHLARERQEARLLERLAADVDALALAHQVDAFARDEAHLIGFGFLQCIDERIDPRQRDLTC